MGIYQHHKNIVTIIVFAMDVCALAYSPVFEHQKEQQVPLTHTYIYIEWIIMVAIQFYLLCLPRHSSNNTIATITGSLLMVIWIIAYLSIIDKEQPILWFIVTWVATVISAYNVIASCLLRIYLDYNARNITIRIELGEIDEYDSWLYNSGSDDDFQRV